MKKLSSFLVLFVSLNLLFGLGVNLRLSDYRWRNDDGNEQTATWKDELNTPVDYASYKNLRLRFVIKGVEGEGIMEPVILFYSKSPTGPWTVIPLDGDYTKDFVMSESPNVNDLVQTTQQLSIGTFEAGHVHTKVNGSTYGLEDVGNVTEVEWCFRPTANATTGTYYFMARQNEMTPLSGGYEQIAELNYIKTSKLIDALCGKTFASFRQELEAIPVEGATQYKFRIYNEELNYLQERTVNTNKMLLGLFTGLQVNTNYKVEVAYYDGAKWIWGEACTITTPGYETTKLNDAFCGKQVESLETLVYGLTVYNTTNYRWEFTKEGDAPIVYELGNNKNRTFLFRVGGLLPETWYNVRVSCFTDGEWRAYGDVCQIKTPSYSTKLRDADCGIEIENINQILYCKPVKGAQNYKYLVQNAATGYSQEYIKGSNSTSFRMGVMKNLIPGLTYTVKVAAMVGGVWGAYGEACNVRLKPVTTKLADANCNIQVPAYNTILYINKVIGAENWRVRFKNDALNYSYIYVRGTNAGAFSMYYIKGLKANTVYDVQISLKMLGEAEWGEWGPICTITTPANKSKEVSENNDFAITVYPNPTSEEFTITSNSPSMITIYNELGQLVRSYELNENNNYELKVTDLSAGIYTVKAISDEGVRTTKVVVFR